MLKRLTASLGERGDTIVEVMIVLAVLGLAIGISYATANRSLLNARQAQENSQAAELVQSQIEQLRTLTTSNCTTSPVDNDHCIYSASPYGGPNTPFCLVGDQVKDAKTNPGCTNAGENGRYALTITRDDTTDAFTVTAKWDDVLGEGKDTVTLSYRLPQPPILAADGGDDSGGAVGGGGGGGGGGGQPQSAPFTASLATVFFCKGGLVGAVVNVGGNPGDGVSITDSAHINGGLTTTPSPIVIGTAGTVQIRVSARYFNGKGEAVMLKDVATGASAGPLVLCRR